MAQPTALHAVLATTAAPLTQLDMPDSKGYRSGTSLTVESIKKTRYNKNISYTVRRSRYGLQIQKKH